MVADSRLQKAAAQAEVKETMMQASALMANNNTAKLLQRQSYYRSKIYTSHIGINALIAAAHPVFSVIERINLSENNPAITALQDNLLHEIRAFITRAKADGYDDETILIAHYLLCATIDETIKKITLRNNGNIADIQLFTPYNQENNDSSTTDQRFLQIFERIINKPDNYLDLIELLYLCLRTGFEGKFLNQPHQQSADILERIYHIISNYRKDNDETLLITTTQPPLAMVQKTLPWKLFTIALALTVSFSYGITNYMLQQQATTIMLELTSLTPHNQQYNY